VFLHNSVENFTLFRLCYSFFEIFVTTVVKIVHITYNPQCFANNMFS